MTAIERPACPRCGDPGFVNVGGERLCGNAGCDYMEPLESGVEMVTNQAEQLRGAVEAERLLAAALEDDHLDPLDIGRAARRALDALRGR